MRKTPVTLGVLSMVFGGLQALMSGFGLLAQPMIKQMMGAVGKAFSGLPKGEGQPDMGQMMERIGKVTEELKVYNYLTNLTMVALSVALFFVGWLLYKRRLLARPLSVTWAIAALAYLPVQLYIQVKIIQPRMMEVTNSMLAGMPSASSSFAQSFAGVQSVVTVVTQLMLYAPLPLVLLGVMGPARAKDDLVGPTPAPM